MENQVNSSARPILTVNEAAKDFVKKASASFNYKKAVEAEMAESMAEFNIKVEKASRALIEHKE